MSRRFGRNQRRRMREEIALLQTVVEHHVAAMGMWRDKSQAAERKLANAEARAFERFMADKDRYEYICARMADQVAKVAGENLKPYAEELMRAANRHRPMVAFDATVMDFPFCETVLTVEWPSVRFRQALIA